MPDSIATFTRDGQTREAYTPAEVVSLKFSGWRLSPAPTIEAAPSPRPTPGPVDLSPIPEDEALPS